MVGARIKEFRELRAPGVWRVAWTFEATLHWGTDSQARVVGVSGDVAIYREPCAANSRPAETHPRTRLACRLQDGGRIIQTHPTDFTVVTELPPWVLDDIESWRSGGQLYARFEGELFLLSCGVNRDPRGGAVVGYPLLDQFGDGGRTVYQRLDSESLEISRDRWCSLLAVLRPPGRIALDLPLGGPSAVEGEPSATLDKLLKARAELDAGAYPNVVRLLYVVLEDLQATLNGTDGLSARYGSRTKERILGNLKELKGLANCERHGGQGAEPERADRDLANYVFAGTAALAAMLLR